MLMSDGWPVFTGARKAAIVVMSMEGVRRAQLLALMGDDEVTAVGSAMARLGAVCAEQAAHICNAFAASVRGGDHIFGPLGNLLGNPEAVRHLLLDRLPPDRSARILEVIRPGARQMRSATGSAGSAHPARVKPAQPAQPAQSDLPRGMVWKRRTPSEPSAPAPPRSLQRETERRPDRADLPVSGNPISERRLPAEALPQGRSVRVAEADRANPGRPALAGPDSAAPAPFAESMGREAPQAVAAPPGHVSPIPAGAPDNFSTQLAQRMKSVQHDLMRGADRSPGAPSAPAAPRHSQRRGDGQGLDPAHPLAFDDLERLAPESVDALIQSVSTDQMAIALRGASERLRNIFLGSLPADAAENLRASIEVQGAVRLREVDEAQAGIVRLAMEMAEQGQIEIDGR